MRRKIVKVPTIVIKVGVVMVIALSASAYSGSSQRNTPIAVGEEAPNFTLDDQNRQKITLADARGKSPVVLVFYRGYW
jgi:cytochrome oxidase Cu insertion factor (SCO1/SenC/PrrC family)